MFAMLGTTTDLSLEVEYICVKLQKWFRQNNKVFYYYTECPLIHGAALKLCCFLTQYTKNVKQTFSCVAGEVNYEQCLSFCTCLAGIQFAPCASEISLELQTHLYV